MNVFLILALAGISIMDARFAIESMRNDAPGIAAFMFFASAFAAAAAVIVWSRLA